MDATLQEDEETQLCFTAPPDHPTRPPAGDVYSVSPGSHVIYTHFKQLNMQRKGKWRNHSWIQTDLYVFGK